MSRTRRPRGFSDFAERSPSILGGPSEFLYRDFDGTRHLSPANGIPPAYPSYAPRRPVATIFPASLSPMTRLRPWLSASLLLTAAAAPLVAQGAATAARRQIVPMDSARARQLYVSNRHEDHPEADYARAVSAKAATDSIFAARAKGVLKFSKITYKSQAGGMTIPAYLFEPLAPKGPGQHAAMVWVHGGVHGNMDQNYWPFIREAVERGTPSSPPTIAAALATARNTTTPSITAAWRSTTSNRRPTYSKPCPT